MDLTTYLFAVFAAFLLQCHSGYAQSEATAIPEAHNKDISTGAYSFIFEYIWVGGSAESRNGRSPEYQVGLDVGLAVGLGFGISIIVVLFTLFYGIMCQDRIRRMDQETPGWKTGSARQTSVPGPSAEGGEVYELKDASSTPI